jgi:hypothetical protein
MIARLPLTALCAALLVFSACDCGPQPATEESATAEAVPIAGMYEVSGSTIGPAPGSERDISGTVVLADKGETYSASFHLDTV